MNRKLWILNLTLVALAVTAGIQLRNRWRADQQRKGSPLHRAIRPIAPPPFTPAPPPGAALPANYLNVAQKDLFDPSRNPDVPVEPPPPPPPPPPMPPLPVYHGAMNLGDGPVAIMSVTAATKAESVRPGERIGEFKLVDITRTDLTLEWNGQTIRKDLYELRSHSAPVAEPAAAVARAEAPPPPKPADTPRAKGPGEVYPSGSRGCQQNDTTPFGAVVDGFKKVSAPTPFGAACIWDPVSK